VAVDGFNEYFNTIYIAKKLFDMGKYELVTESFFDSLDLDTYYENMYTLIQNLFEYQDSRYYEHNGIELHIISDPVMVDFFMLAGKYGKRNNIPDAENPYIKAAQQETSDNLALCYCLDWKLMGHTDPKRPFHSRLGLFMSDGCGCLDLGVLAYKLLILYEWFANSCVELCNLLDDTMGGRQISIWEEAIAA
jgi:hypothetical protein